MAARFLEAEGWEVLARNWRDGPRELDLVIFRDGVLAFVEVKSRTPSHHGHPLESLGQRKRREVERAARAWLRRAQEGGEAIPGTLREVRFDALAVHLLGEGAHRIEHHPDAWRI